MRLDLEPLEPRQMLSVSQDPAGWTIVSPASDTRVIYVSSSLGSDGNSGLSPDSPVQSVSQGKSLLRDGAGDELLLHRGDVWHESIGRWQVSGASASQPALIGAYGTGARPLLETGSSVGFALGSSNALHDIDVIGIDFYADGRDPSSSTYNSNSNADGFSVAGAVNNVLLEDVSVEGYRNNLVFQSYFGQVSNITVRRSQITDSYSSGALHSQGAYFGQVSGVVLEGNLFDHNGWNEAVAGASPTVYNHNVYVTGDSNGLIARDNIFANASSHGLQARPGGIIENNLFLNNAIGLSFGLVNGAGPMAANGVSGDVIGNAFIGARDISGSPRGIGLEMSNIGAATMVSDNVFAGNPNGIFPAIQLIVGHSAEFGLRGVGINHLTLQNNIIYNWDRGVYISDQLTPGGSGPTALNDLTITGNDFQSIHGSQIIWHGVNYNSAVEHWGSNRYDTNGATAAVYLGNSQSFLQWQGQVDSSSTEVQAAYSDPTRTPGRYDQALGGAATNAAFVNNVRQQSAGRWNPLLTARAVLAYIRAGFSEGGQSHFRNPVIPPPPENVPGVPDSTQTGTGVGVGGLPLGGGGSTGGTTGGGTTGGGTTSGGTSSGGTTGGGTSGGSTGGSAGGGTSSGGGGTSSGGGSNGGTSGGTSSGGGTDTGPGGGTHFGNNGGDPTSSGGSTSSGGGSSSGNGSSSGGTSSGGTSGGGTTSGGGSTGSSGGTGSGNGSSGGTGTGGTGSTGSGSGGSGTGSGSIGVPDEGDSSDPGTVFGNPGDPTGGIDWGLPLPTGGTTGGTTGGGTSGGGTTTGGSGWHPGQYNPPTPLPASYLDPIWRNSEWSLGALSLAAAFGPSQTGFTPNTGTSAGDPIVFNPGGTTPGDATAGAGNDLIGPGGSTYVVPPHGLFR